MASAGRLAACSNAQSCFLVEFETTSTSGRAAGARSSSRRVVAVLVKGFVLHNLDVAGRVATRLPVLFLGVCLMFLAARLFLELWVAAARVPARVAGAVFAHEYRDSARAPLELLRAACVGDFLASLRSAHGQHTVSTRSAHGWYTRSSRAPTYTLPCVDKGYLSRYSGLVGRSVVAVFFSLNQCW